MIIPRRTRPGNRLPTSATISPLTGIRRRGPQPSGATLKTIVGRCERQFLTETGHAHVDSKNCLWRASVCRPTETCLIPNVGSRFYRRII